jgi:DNA polymerase-4
MPKVFFHVDVNSAFLSWSAVKRLRAGDPVDLRTIAAAVGGDEQTRHGVVLAKSIPARRCGIHTGESLFAARAKCPGLLVVPPDFDCYVRSSKALMHILQEYTPDVEQYSIDEAFLDMTGTEGLSGAPEAAAQALRARVKRELGFTVNIGIAQNRLLAKMASDFEKPDKVHTLWQSEIAQKMWPLPVGSLFSVGPRAVERLQRAGLLFIGDVAKTPRAVLLSMFGERGGTIWDYANGIESEPITKAAAREPSYGNSTTTPRDLTQPAQADSILLALSDSVASRLRMDKKAARVISVQLTDNTFRHFSHQTALESPTNSTDALYHTAQRLLREMWPKRPVRLVGVTAERTGEENFEQLDLFTDTGKQEKQEKLDRAADALRAKFGDHAVMRAKLLEDKPGKGALSAARERDRRKGSNGDP